MQSDLQRLQARAKRELASSKRPLFLQTRGSVWSSTRVPIVAFTIYGFLIYLLNKANLAPNVGRGASSLSSVLAMITGLMISYRSGSSSDRWHEGRKIFASLTSSTRVLLTTLTLSLPPPSSSAEERLRQKESVDDLLSLIVAYAYAFKHHLRDADPLSDPAFTALLPKKLLYSFQTTPYPQRTFSAEALDDSENFTRILNDKQAAAKTTPSKVGATKLGGPRNMPLLLLRQIQSMLNDFHTTTAPSRGSPGSETVLLETPTWANCLGVLKEMTDQLSQAERIRDTPIPLALGIHVQQMLVLYCVSIPPQLVEILGLWVVPVSAVVAWTFFGVDSAAAQLSDPFGWQDNDLPTDKFVQGIHNEYLEIVGSGSQSGSSANDEMMTLPESVGEKAKGQ